MGKSKLNYYLMAVMFVYTVSWIWLFTGGLCDITTKTIASQRSYEACVAAHTPADAWVMCEDMPHGGIGSDGTISVPVVIALMVFSPGVLLVKLLSVSVPVSWFCGG